MHTHSAFLCGFVGGADVHIRAFIGKVEDHLAGWRFENAAGRAMPSLYNGFLIVFITVNSIKRRKFIKLEILE